MSDHAPTNLPWPGLRWCQFSLGSLFVVLTIAAIAVAWYASQPRPGDPIRIRINKSGASVDSRAAADLSSRLARRVQGLHAAGLDPATATVLVQVDDDVAYWHARRVLQECWRAGLRAFVLDRRGERSQIHVYVPPPLSDFEDRGFGESLDVMLRADDRGALARISVGSWSVDAQSETPLVHLQTLVSHYLTQGVFDGVTLCCDDNLEFWHVIGVMDAVGVEARKQVPLAQRVKLALATCDALRRDPRN